MRHEKQNKLGKQANEKEDLKPGRAADPLFLRSPVGHRTGLMFRLTPSTSSVSTMVQLLPG